MASMHLIAHLSRTREVLAAGATTISRNLKPRTYLLMVTPARRVGGDDGVGATYGVARDSNPNQQLGSGVLPWPRSLRSSSMASVAVPQRSS